MLNASDQEVSGLGLIDYQDPIVAEKMAHGRMNTTETVIHANIRSAIRRGLPQMKPLPVRPDHVCLVGNGPSLNDTEDELRELLWKGATLITLNGAYHWCRERNLRPQTQIVMDARPWNARFVQPHTPKCNYILASQCAPEMFEAVKDYPHTWIFHPVVKDEGVSSAILDDYYQTRWMGVGGGTTVATRALSLLRMSGIVRYDLFGIDCCWMDDQHHAQAQPENKGDRYSTVRLSVKGGSEVREFKCSGWMLKQLEDFATHIKVNGKSYVLTSHGDGMLTHLLRLLASADPDDVSIESEPVA